jgi:hypothetical protein
MEWDESAVIALISGQVQESLSLEYKSCDSLKPSDNKARSEIGKDVSSFANSAGGVLIYGVIEYNNHLPEKLDTGYDPAVITREWLENIITSTIHPRINGVIITQVQLSTASPGRVLYVVDIPQSDTAHQASEFKYYKRHNFKSQPMEDYEVRDVMNRATAPDLQIHVRRVPCPADGAGNGRLQLGLVNRGKVIAKYASCVSQVLNDTYQFASCLDSILGPWFPDQEVSTLVRLIPHVGRVVYPDLPISLGYVEWAPKPTTTRLPATLETEFRVYAEGMPYRTTTRVVETGIPAKYE